MQGQCHGRLETVHDGCLKIVKRCVCGKQITQRKRRREGYLDSECSWVVPCADHPTQTKDKVMKELNWETQKQINEVTLAALHKIEEAFIVLGGMVEELNNQIRELDNQIGKNSK